MVNVTFVHPDLGIGGAERLVIDAAIALKTKGHHVQFITAHHDSNHCFVETINGQLNVTCVGDWLPRSTFGRMYAFWAYLRMIYIAFYLIFFMTNTDVAFVDQISACIPILRLNRKLKIMFYCHFPDQLLTDRKTFLKAKYRQVIDYVEERTTRMADTVLVNSKFTAGVFKETFHSIVESPNILYPTLDVTKFDRSVTPLSPDILDTSDKIVFLSLNRYERKKHVDLALEALKVLFDNNEASLKSKVHLIIAGGHDHRVVENIEYYQELVARARQYELEGNVTFLKSPVDDIKLALLNESDCLLYTPDKEHFGIVPLEAMYMGTPVIAVNSGGPVETVIVGKTGFLREQTGKAFAEAMQQFVDNPDLKKKMQHACTGHVLSNFSFNKFANNLNIYVSQLLPSSKQD